MPGPRPWVRSGGGEPEAARAVSHRQNEGRAGPQTAGGQDHNSQGGRAMVRFFHARSVRLAVCALAALALFTGSTGWAADQTSRPFTGKAVNGGTVTVTQQ